MTSGYGAGGDITNNNASCLYNCALTNCNAAENNDPRSKPDVLFNRNVFVNIGLIVGQGITLVIMIRCDHEAGIAAMKIVTDDNVPIACNMQAIHVNI